MDSNGTLVAVKLKEAFAEHEGPVDTKVADKEMFVDACIAKDGEFGPLCCLHPIVIFLNWLIIFFYSKLVFCHPSVRVYFFLMDKT
jgi:hypothetical protein